MSRILFAYDGSPGARRALERLAGIVADGDEVTILNVVPALTQALASHPDRRHANQALRETDAADARRALFEKGALSTTQVAEGDPAPVICGVAARGEYDVIVMGTRHLHGIHRIARTSVTSYVIRNGPCDVMVIH